MNDDHRKMHITMPDGSIWAVPVMVIARDRAAHYAGEFGDNLERSLREDTLPAFAEDSYEIKDWAANNMNWSDVREYAVQVSAATPDFQEGWMNGRKAIVA